MCYTLHWILIKDFRYLQKKELANLKSMHYTATQIIAVVLWKIFYCCYMLVVPIAAGYKPVWVLAAFLLMHAVISLFFVWTLIISHLCEETGFPAADGDGRLPYNFHEHQLAVSLDYHPQSTVANWIFGGFNAHTAHHLFHRLPHTAYPFIAHTIRQTAEEFHYPYHALPIHKAILSHYRHLKRLGRQ
jgi:linoleoyl-CoA desaturase